MKKLIVFLLFLMPVIYAADPPPTCTPVYTPLTATQIDRLTNRSIPIFRDIKFGTVLDSIIDGSFDVMKPQKFTYVVRSFGGTNFTLPAADSGKLITATVSSNFTLPTAVIGMTFIFINASGVTITVNPADTDQILALTDTAGDKISNATAGNMVILNCALVETWSPIVYGTWSDAD